VGCVGMCVCMYVYIVLLWVWVVMGSWSGIGLVFGSPVLWFRLSFVAFCCGHHVVVVGLENLEPISLTHLVHFSVLLCCG